MEQVDLRFNWIKHDQEREFLRITKRGTERDGYKLHHWKEYTQGIADIKPDDRYNAYCYDNDSTSIDELCADDIIKWI